MLSCLRISIQLWGVKSWSDIFFMAACCGATSGGCSLRAAAGVISTAALESIFCTAANVAGVVTGAIEENDTAGADSAATGPSPSTAASDFFICGSPS